MPLFRHAILLAGLAGFACTGASAADLNLRVQDVPSAQGRILVAVYDSAGSFLKRPARAVQVPAAAGSLDVVIKDLPPGEYGIALFHDSNGNGKMDMNAMGIPAEDHAFSNNALGNMGPPSFEQVKFVLPAAGASTTINLR